MHRRDTGSTTPRTLRLAALVCVAALTVTACGARLTKDQRAAAIAASGSGTSGTGSFGDFGGTQGEPGFGGGDVLGDQTAGGGTSGGGGAGRSGTGGSGGGSAGGGNPGNLRATDTGVTPSEIVVATLADVSGIQPGLFQAVHDAAKAATAYINSQGGINGRQVRLLPLDSKTDSGGNRAAMLEACDKAFAVVGSMSAFDDGSARPGEECGIPDMTAITTNAPKFHAKNTFPAFPNGPELIGLTPPTVIKQRFGDAVIKKAGALWLNQTVTRASALRRVEAWTSVGFDFIYQQEVQVLEADYSRFVLEMRNRGVEYVTMVSDYQNIVRLQKAMRQQNYFPTVRDWDSVAFDQGYIELGGEAVEDSLVFINTAPFSDVDRNPEMQLYFTWLRRAAPNRNPSYFGIYAWSAFRLFQELATEIGPDLTREKLLAALGGVKSWDGHGIHVEHNIGDKRPGNCNSYITVKDGQFRRYHPAEGFSCEGGLYQLKGDYE